METVRHGFQTDQAEAVFKAILCHKQAIFSLHTLQQTPVIYFISFATGIKSFSKVKYIYLPCFSLLGLFEGEGKHQD